MKTIETGRRIKTEVFVLDLRSGTLTDDHGATVAEWGTPVKFATAEDAAAYLENNNTRGVVRVNESLAEAGSPRAEASV